MAKKKSSKKRNNAKKQTPTANPKPQETASATRTAVKSKKTARADLKAREARMKQIRIIGIVVLLVGGFVGLAMFRNAGAVATSDLVESFGPTIDGSKDAPVILVEYGDLACSACRQWHNLGIKEQLKQQYGDQVAFEFKHFPVVTANSPRGAEAAQCAHEQGMFWEYHDYIFENLETYPAFTSDRVKEIATAVGVDREAFDTCVDSGKYRTFVTDAIRDAQSAGARGTPTFFVNGRQVSFSFEAMSAAIEEELN
ncbi:MAG: thioredoxin domain-containing protein [Chloroflexota bacterium]